VNASLQELKQDLDRLAFTVATNWQAFNQTQQSLTAKLMSIAENTSSTTTSLQELEEKLDGLTSIVAANREDFNQTQQSMLNRITVLVKQLKPAENPISELAAGQAFSVYAVDLDNDGDMDVLSASQNDDTIAWYRNFGNGCFSSQLVISTTANGVRSVWAADLDNDGDMDVLSASPNDDKIAWYRNDGSGSFSSQLVISTAADGARLCSRPGQ
jgi:cell fate (sporulation/competence/biofilm development) regulator YlbF (YheA/YmcA/DUF963 family)